MVWVWPASAPPGVLAALQQISTPDSAAYHRSDRALSRLTALFWLDAENNLYFPEPNPLFYEDLDWSQSTRLDRLRVLTTLSQYLLPGFPKPAEAPVIVAPIRAIMTRTVPRRDFIKQTMRIKLNDKRDLPALAAHLVGIGYEYSNIVVQPGQFSRRGGILDVWSPSDNRPYRLDFFGDEIDTLRFFDPATQRSEGKLENVTIFPTSEAMPIAGMADGELPYQLREQDIPNLYRFPSSLIDFLPADTLILLDVKSLSRQRQRYWEDP